MSNILSFEFEELALVSYGDIHAAMINGMAEIKYDRSGHWEIDSVTVEGHQPLTTEQRAAGKKPWVYVAAPAALESIIFDRLLDSEWNGRIDTAVREQLASDRDDAAEMRADMRRDHSMGL
jgi:hypothetical protein